MHGNTSEAVRMMGIAAARPFLASLPINSINSTDSQFRSPPLKATLIAPLTPCLLSKPPLTLLCPLKRRRDRLCYPRKGTTHLLSPLSHCSYNQSGLRTSTNYRPPRVPQSCWPLIEYIKILHSPLLNLLLLPHFAPSPPQTQCQPHYH
ncbi:hypothetical protein PtB15_5B778 [Puccinia triticina]|nr:hypothetical protein PtB15_5B778 [Puccinia triticina]